MKKKEIVTLALTTALLMTAHAVPASAASNAPESMSQTGSIQTITPRWESTNVVVPSISISGKQISVSVYISPKKSTTSSVGTLYLEKKVDGSASGNIMGVTTKRGTNTATLSGFMIDAKGVSFTAPDVSSSLTY
mgnify:CR=1 FL=1